MLNRILFLSFLVLFILFNKLTAQHTHHDSDNELKGEFEIFKSDMEGFKFSLTSSLYPLVVGKKIVFSIKGSSPDNEKQFDPCIMSLNIFKPDENISKLVFTKHELEDKYVLDYTFWKSGKYNFGLEIQNADSLAENKISKFSFTQVVKEIGESNGSDSHHSGMGMGSVMLIVMGVVMLVSMVLISMGSSGH